MCIWILCFFPGTRPWFYSNLQAPNSFCALPCLNGIKTCSKSQCFSRTYRPDLPALSISWPMGYEGEHVWPPARHPGPQHRVVRKNLDRSPAQVLLALWHLFLLASSRIVSSCPASLLLFCIFRFGALGESPKLEMQRNTWSHLILPLPVQDYSPQFSLECLLQSIFKWLKGEGFPLLPGEAGSVVQ